MRQKHFLQNASARKHSVTNKILYYGMLLAILFCSLFIQAQTVWNGPLITFTKADYANPTLPQNQDRITPTTWITRGDTHGIFNIFSESLYTNGISPVNTEWATGELADYASLTYQPWESWTITLRNPPATVGKQAVLHLITEDIYIGIKFLSWTSGGNGGGFMYQRTTPGTSVLEMFYRDADGDGFGNLNDFRMVSSQPVGFVKDNTDCDDSRASVHPGAPEVCDGLDNDCSGTVDDVTLSSLTLVNATTGKDLLPLTDGEVLDLAGYPNTKWNIRANTSPSQVGSVVFHLQGPLTRTHTENLLPYALLGDDMKGGYHGATLPVGDYTLTATPYCGPRGSGTKGTPLTTHFKVTYSATVRTFTLVNADTDKDIGELKDGDVIDLALLPPGTRLNIRAGTLPSRVGSVSFELGGQQVRKHIENSAPYALFANDRQNYFGWTPQVGSYTLTATPHSDARAGGVKGSFKTIQFKVIYSATVSSFTLVNADTDKDVKELKEGDVIDLATLPPITKLSVRAGTAPNRVGSVAFELSGAQSYKRTENSAPYTLFANQKSDCFGRSFPPGDYTLSATPYSAARGTGTKGIPLVIHFKVVNKVQQPCTTPSFAPTITFNSFYFNSAMASGDFNSDGKPDLVVLSSSSNDRSGTIEVLYGSGNGRFVTMKTYSSGGLHDFFKLKSIIASDFNQDDNLDLAVTNSGSNNVGILLGDGNGSFRPVVTFPSNGNVPTGMATGDYNGDSKPDLAVINAATNNIGILINNGGGGFVPTIAYSSVGPHPTSIVTTDLNSDKKQDLIVLSEGDISPFGRVTVLLGSGNGSFAPAVNYSSGGIYVNSVVSGDVNSDSKIDIVVGNDDNFVVFLGDGLGGLTPIGTFKYGYLSEPGTLAMADFNDDGKMDIVVSYAFRVIDYWDYKVFMLLGKGDGSFAQPYQVFHSEEVYPNPLLVGDYNGDNKPDLAFLNFRGNPGSVLLNTCGYALLPVLTAIVQKNQERAMATKRSNLSAHPNPFSSASTIRFSVEQTGYVILSVYDIRGVEIKRLHQGQIEGGREYQKRFVSKDLSAGVYILRLATEKSVETYKIVLVQ